MEIKMVWENLALAMALWTGMKKGLITRAHLPTGRAVVPSNDGLVVEVINPLHLASEQDLARCINNHVRGAVTFSAIQAHNTLSRVYRNPPLREADPDLRAARCAISLLNNSLSRGMLAPVWDCPAAYRRLMEVRPIAFVLDASALDGKPVSWDDFGGLDKYLDLLQYCARRLNRAELHAEDSPGASDRILGARENQLSMTLLDDGLVGAFVDAECLVDLGAQAMAKDLYTGYRDWCQGTDRTPLAQRSFGIQLTNLGFARKRRGRGRHWWQGIGLAER
jgi:hypothetical protein